MKCPICDRTDDNITIDPRDGRWTTCYVCNEIIMDASGSSGDDLEERYLLDSEDQDVGC